MPIRRIRRALAALVVTAVSTGCFEYIPIDVLAVPAGGHVRVYLTVQESRRLEDEGTLAGIEVGSPPALTGRLARSAEEMLYLRVPVRGPQVGFQSEPLEQEIPLRAEGVAALEWRELNRLGTAAIAIAGAALVGGIAYFILNDSNRPVDSSVPMMKTRSSLSSRFRFADPRRTSAGPATGPTYRSRGAQSS